jgi:hypothetical protein
MAPPRVVTTLWAEFFNKKSFRSILAIAERNKPGSHGV